MGQADSFYLLCFDDRHRDVTICVMKFHLCNGSDYRTFLQAGARNACIYLFIYLSIYLSANSTGSLFMDEEGFSALSKVKEK